MRYKVNPLGLEELRRLARERSVVPGAQDAAALSAEEVRKLLEELGTSRLELEIQNEYLQDTYARLEKALGQSRDFYDFAPVGCAVTDAQGCITLSNLACAHLLGLPPASLLRRAFESFFVPTQRDGLRALMAQAIQSGDNQRCDLALADAHAPCQHLQLDIAPLVQGMGCQLVLTDVSERKRAEEELRNSEARWKFAVDTVGDGLWDWQLSQGTMHYSDQLMQLYGYSRTDFGDMLELWRTLVHPEDQAGFLTSLQQCLSGGTTRFDSEIRVLCKNGAWKWVLCRGAVFARDNAGRVERLIGTHTDISACKQPGA